MSNAGTNDRFQTQYIIRWWFCAMAITPPAPPQQHQQQQQQQQQQEKKQQQQQPQLENDFSLNKSVDTLTRFSPRLRAGNSVDWFPATVRSDCPAFDATTMPRFRSRISVDAYSQPRFAQTWSLQRYYNATVSLRNFRRRDPKQRFARAWKPSTLLQCYGFARELPSTRFRSKGSLGPGGRRRYYTMVGFRSGTSVDAVPKQRFAQAWKPSTLIRASLQ